MGIDHTFVDDLTGTLTSPDGQTAELFSGADGGGNNLCQVVFDDAADHAVLDRGHRRRAVHRHVVAGPAAELADHGAGRRHVDVQRRPTAATFDTGTLRAVSLHVTGFVSS